MIITLCKTWVNLANESLFSLIGYNCYFNSHFSCSGLAKTVLYIFGDLNINLLNFPANRYSLELINTLLMHGFCPFINKLTRETASTISSIDDIITNYLMVLDESVK